jgi:hypothetical protein
VTRVNHAPVLVPIPDQTIRAGDSFSFQAVATDPDGDSLIFSLDTNSPPGVVIEPYTGLVTWPSGPNAGSTTNPITIQVLDNGRPRLGAVRRFNISVAAVNTPPTLDPIPDQTVSEGHLLVITNRATDLDVGQTLSFSLAPGAPAGAHLDAASGAVSWRPTSAQGGTTNRFSLIVQDNGLPSLSATQSFNVFVLATRSDFALQIGSTNLNAGQDVSLPVSLIAGSDLQHLAFTLSATDGHLANLELLPGGNQVSSAGLQPMGNGSYQIDFTLDPAHSPSGQRLIGTLSMQTRTTGHSAVARLDVQSLTGERVGGEAMPHPSGQGGRLFIVEGEPLLDATPFDLNNILLTVYGRPGTTYRLQHSPTLGAPAVWSLDQSITLLNPSQDLEHPWTPEQPMFFRLVAP